MKTVNPNLSTYRKMTREQFAKKSLELLQHILDSNHPDRLELSNTPYGYKGTNNMTMEELKEHHRILYENYHNM